MLALLIFFSKPTWHISTVLCVCFLVCFFFLWRWKGGLFPPCSKLAPGHLTMTSPNPCCISSPCPSRGISAHKRGSWPSSFRNLKYKNEFQILNSRNLVEQGRQILSPSPLSSHLESHLHFLLVSHTAIRTKNLLTKSSHSSLLRLQEFSTRRYTWRNSEYRSQNLGLFGLGILEPWKSDLKWERGMNVALSH